MSGHARFLDLCAAHALEALDDADRRILDEHLAGCAACRAALVELDHGAALLAGAASPARPRPEVRGQVLASVRRAAAADAVLRFWRKVQADARLRARLAPLRLGDPGTPDAVLAIARGEGFPFGREDLEGVGAASAFCGRVSRDPGLRGRLDRARAKGSLGEQRAEVLRIATDAGLAFEPEHLLALVVPREELSDDDLALVAAAAGPPAPPLFDPGAHGTIGDALAEGRRDQADIPGFHG